MADAEVMVGKSDAPEVRLIISDFGGVICSFDYQIFCRRLARRIRRTADEVFVTVFGDRLQQDFEAGNLSALEYHQTVMTRLRADVSFEEFFPMYGDIFTEIPATCDLFLRLHRRYPLYLLSDTNEIHFGFVRNTVSVLSVFDAFILSYQVGALKPDPRVYREALRRSGLPANACLFVDDRPGNVEGALRVGMHAVLFTSPDQFVAELGRAGVVIP